MYCGSLGTVLNCAYSTGGPGARHLHAGRSTNAILALSGSRPKPAVLPMRTTRGEVDRAQTRSIWVTSGRQLWVLRFLTQPIPDSILSPCTAHRVPNTPIGDTGYAQLAQVATTPTQELSYQIVYETPSVPCVHHGSREHTTMSTNRTRPPRVRAVRALQMHASSMSSTATSVPSPARYLARLLRLGGRETSHLVIACRKEFDSTPRCEHRSDQITLSLSFLTHDTSRIVSTTVGNIQIEPSTVP